MTASPGSRVAELYLSAADWLRVCRDIAWSEIHAMPGGPGLLGPRVASLAAAPLDWSSGGFNLDSLARMQLATAAAVWCNAYDSGFEDLFLAKRSTADWAVAMQRARAAGSRHFTFSTSGSTGARKHVRHREDVLAAEASVWADVLCGRKLLNDAQASDTPRGIPPSTINRVLVLCPTHHIYGFIWGVLLPRALGVAAIDAEVSSLPALQPGDLIVAVPDQWAWLAQSRRHWPEGVQGVSSTAPLPEAVHRALWALPTISADAHAGAPPATKLARLFQIYGSTETGGLAYRLSPDAPYILAPGRSRSAAGGMALTLADGSVATLDVQDELEWADHTDQDNNGAADPGAGFHILRRSDLCVQVGGHNVSPGWVADQLLMHPAVSKASVRLGTVVKPPRLKAFVVLTSPASTAQRAAVEQWATDTLPWYANLSSIAYGDEIPLNAIGKPSDWPEPLPEP